jgi:polyhydroxybutyrate depolymerase
MGGCISKSAAPEVQVVSVPIGSSTQTIVVDGLRRTFHVYRPGSLPSAARSPLVVFLHGGFGSGSQAERSYGWDAEAARGQFLVVYPDGTNHAWNAGGGCCGKPAESNVDDVAFISKMVALLEREVPIDPDAVYATGISNGGIMSYRLACATTIFAAIGPDSATMLGACPSPSPISVIHIHGTADTRIPYGGGEGSGEAKIDGPSVPSVNATWRNIDGCAAPDVTVSGSVTTSLAGCPGGRAVELVTIAGAGHQWPGGVDRPLIQMLLGLDPPSSALHATSTIWAFFSAHPKEAT